MAVCNLDKHGRGLGDRGERVKMPKFILSKQFYFKLSDICADIAQVGFAALIIPLFTGEKRVEHAYANILIIIFLWVLSLEVAQKSKEAE